jgi:hypothetical protein
LTAPIGTAGGLNAQTARSYDVELLKETAKQGSFGIPAIRRIVRKLPAPMRIYPIQICMPCQERDRLQKAHSDAGEAFDLARQALQIRMGVCPKDEFRLLDQATKKAWENLQGAHKALDNHIRTHGCEKTQKI